MNGLDILLIVLIAATVLLAVLKIRSDHKKGRSCTGCGSSCSGCDSGCMHRKDGTKS